MSPQRSKLAKRPAGRAATPLERIDQVAYELFSRHGIRAVGIDKVVAKSGVAKATLYRHYPTKNHLALAFLRRREELWTHAWLRRELERRPGPPARRLLAIFEAFDGWFHGPRFEGCAFVNAMLESGGEEPVIRSAAIAHLATIRGFLARLARQARVADPTDFSWKWHILMEGSIIAAGEGDRNAARRARAMGRLLLAEQGIAIARQGRRARAGGSAAAPG